MTSEEMETDLSLMDLSLVCRGCLASTGEMKNMVEWGLADEFCRLTNIQVSRSEDVSELLCGACEEVLMKFRSFTAQCQQSDILLKNTVKRRHSNESASANTIQEFSTEENTVSCSLQDNKLVISITAPNTESKIYLPCPYQCQEKFQKRTDLLTHLMKTHHLDRNFSVELQYYCSIKDCSYSMNSRKNKFFSGRKYLNQHNCKVHRTKTHFCQNCNAGFATGTELNRHLKTCNYIYLCQACNQQFKSNEKLLVHLLRKHPDLHKQYKIERKAEKRKSQTAAEAKKVKTDAEKFAELICESPKRSFATQTLELERNIRNDVTLPSWQQEKIDETKKDEISTQTVFEDLLSLKSQTSEDDSIFFSETVSLSDIQTQTIPLEFGLSRSNKETITSETQSPDLSIKETQTCFCLYESPKPNFRCVDSVSSSPGNPFSMLTSTETQTLNFRNLDSDVLSSFTSAETQTCFDDDLNKDL